jgi:hypothetical protein
LTVPEVNENKCSNIAEIHFDGTIVVKFQNGDISQNYTFKFKECTALENGILNL